MHGTRGRIAILFGWTAAAVLVALAACRPATAQTTPEIRHATYGFMVQSRNAHMAPLELQLVNRGPAVDVVLTAVTGGGGHELVLRRAAHLPANSLSRVSVPCGIEVVETEIGHAQTLFPVMLGDGRAERWHRFEVMGLVLPARRPTVLIADRRGASYRLVGGRGAPEGAMEANRLTSAPNALPRQAAAYDGVDVIVLGELDPGVPDRAQAAAIGTWLASGGLLVRVPADTPDTGHWGEIDAAWPAAWEAAVGVETLPPLLPGGDILAGRGRLARAAMRSRGGRLLTGEPADPIAVAGDFGEGRIVMLSYDAGTEAFQQWDQAPVVWTDLMERAGLHRLRAARPFDGKSDAVQETMRLMAGVRVAPRTLILGYLGATLLLFTVLLLAGRLAGRPEWGWAAALAAALILGTGLTVIAMRSGGRERPVAVETGLANADHDGGGATLRGALGFYAPHDTAFQVALADDGSVLRPGTSGIRPPPVFPTAWEGGRLHLDRLRLRARELRFTTGSARIAAPDALRPTAHIGPDGLRLEIAPAEAPYEEAFFRVRRLAVPLGDLAGRAPSRHIIRPNDRGAGFRTSHRTVLRAADELRDRLRALLFPPFDPSAIPGLSLAQGGPDAAAVLASEPALYAFADRPAWPLTVASPESDRIALTLWRFPVTFTYDAERLLWPRGSLPRRILRRSPATREHPDGTLAGLGPDEIDIAFDLPADAPRLAADALRVFFEAEGEGFAFLAELLPADGRGASQPVPRGLHAATEVPRFVTDDGRVLLRVRVRPEGERGMRIGQGWRIRDVEIELGGLRADPPEGNTL